jgi:thymidylate kinase
VTGRDAATAPDPGTAAGAFPEGTLTLVRDVLGRLHGEGIRYCQWKSTTGLPKALAGGTDLDLLVDRGQASAFSTAVTAAGFKPFISHPSRRFLGVEDWLGHDPESGRLVHLHVYYRLVLGEDHVKNHVLPIEAAMLDRAELRNGVMVPPPATELVVLTIRALLKYRRTDALKDALGLGRRGGVPPEIRAEVEDLATRATAGELEAAARQLVPTVDSRIFSGFVEVLRTDRRNARVLLRLRAAMRRQLRQFERLPARTAMAISLRARLVRAPGLRRILRPRSRADLRRKSPAAGGLTVAIVGADGAGKTTVVDEVVRWLGWRLNLRVAYLGTARPSSRTAAIRTVSRVARRAATGARRFASFAGGPLTWSATLLTALRYLAEAGERAQRVREGRRLAANGALVLFDRYPLRDVRLPTRPMDGPRVAGLGPGADAGVLGLLRRREEAIYRRIPAPDLTLLLAVSPDVALARKPSAEPSTVVDKARAVLAAAASADGDATVVIDASQPLPDVVRAVEAEIWRRL